MKINHFWVLLLVTMLENTSAQSDKFDWQGHRGCRGLMPENSIPAFLKALEFEQVSTLELDVVWSKDGELIVSHDPWMESEFCFSPEGKAMTQSEAEGYKLWLMTAEEIRKFDAGSKGNKRFPQQQLMPTYKPTLREVVVAVRNYCNANRRAFPNFNIEIKSYKEWYNVSIPAPSESVPMALAYIKTLDLEGHYNLQSFDLLVLQEIHRLAPNIRVAFLVENLKSIDENLKELGFTPHIYSPYYKLLTEKRVKKLHKLGIQVIPWTVNDAKAIKKLIKCGVDGIITDYPNLIE